MPHLKEGEKVLLIKRRHWLVLVLHLLPSAVIFAGIILALLVLPFISLGPLFDWLEKFSPSIEFNFKFALDFLLVIFLLIFWQIIFVQVAHYYLDCWIVTDQRTLHTELIGLFNRFLTSIYHHKIQDISVDVHGILPTFLNYGNVQIQTAGAHREFIFREIPEPYKTKDVIVLAQMNFLRKIKEKGLSLEKIEKAQEGPVEEN